MKYIALISIIVVVSCASIQQSYAGEAGQLNWTYQLENPSSGGETVGILPNGNIVFLDGDRDTGPMETLARVKCLDVKGNLLWVWEKENVFINEWQSPLISSTGEIFLVTSKRIKINENSYRSERFICILNSEGQLKKQILKNTAIGSITLDRDDNLYTHQLSRNTTIGKKWSGRH